MNADRGAYIHIVKNLSEEDKTSLDGFDKENNREWLDASAIWLGGSLPKSGMFNIRNNVPMMAENEAIVIRNRLTEQKFNYFT